MMSRLPGEKIKKRLFYFFKLSPIANLNFENLLLFYLKKNITARSFKLGQLFEDDK